MRSDQLHRCLVCIATESTHFRVLGRTLVSGTQVAVTNGMKTMSPWMPEAADESTMLELIRQMLDLGILITPGAGGGFRISVDPDPATDSRTADAKLIPAAVQALEPAQREARSGSPTARSAAAQALAAFGVPALPVLIDLLGDSDLDVRVQTVSSLGRLGAVAQPAAPALVKAAGQSVGPPEGATVLALGAIIPVSDAR